jgi:integrase
MSQPEHRFLTASHVDRLADAMPDHQYRTLVYILAYGGLRWGELVALGRRRIDVLARRVEVAESATEISGRLVFGSPKTHQRRTVHLPGFVAQMLGEHMARVPEYDDALIFTAPRGGPLRSRNVRRTVWDPARARAGTDVADITPHDLRHTCASLMRAAGADVKAIQQQLGHRNATVTLNTYTHLFEGGLEEVMSRLDQPVTSETRPGPVLAPVAPIQQMRRNPDR